MTDIEAPVTRARAKEQIVNSALIQEIVKDILHNERFTSLVEESVNKRMNEMELTIEKQKAEIFDLQNSNESKSKEISKLKEKVDNQQNHLQRLDNLANKQEQYSRRNCLRLFGCTERRGENTDKIVMDLVTGVLKVDLNLDDIERSHRVGKRKEETGGKVAPRGIIIKFKSYRKRQEVLANRRKLKGTKKSLVEDLTQRNQELLSRVKKASPVVMDAWSADGRIIALLAETDDNGKHLKQVIHSMEQVESLKKK